MARSRKNKRTRLIRTLVIVAAVLLIAAAAWYIFRNRDKFFPFGNGEHGSVDSSGNGEHGSDDSSGNGGSKEPARAEALSIHFLELGNPYAGDCIYIQIGNVDILIDGGSRESSADTIEAYVDQYCTDGILEYVIVTHADQDHIAAFAGNGTYPSLFERYDCRTIIDFPRTDKTTKVYGRYVEAREREIEAGADHYTALECYRETGGAKRSYALAEGVSMNFLYNYYYEHSSNDENNYSVCMYLRQGDSNYLFTGDLEEKGEELLVEYNELPHCKLFKAGHHGSRTSSTEKLLSIIRPEIVCICCCAGAPEYTTNPDNTFPTRETLERLHRYTDEIYVTGLAVEVDLQAKKWEYAPLNGTIVFSSDGVNDSVTGTNHSLKLKDTDWYRENRS